MFEMTPSYKRPALAPPREEKQLRRAPDIQACRGDGWDNWRQAGCGKRQRLPETGFSLIDDSPAHKKPPKDTSDCPPGHRFVRRGAAPNPYQ